MTPDPNSSPVGWAPLPVRVPAVRVGNPGDAAAVSALVADSFADLGVCRNYLVPHPVRRAQILPAYFAITVEHALRHGQVDHLPGFLAAAVWLPVPGTPPVPGHAGRLAAATGERLERFAALEEAMETVHPPTPAHLYLAFLAVRADCQGQGLGSRLLAHRHAVLDGIGLPAYLEAADARSRGLYARHGYTDHGGPLALPDTGETMFPMWREPRGGGTCGAGGGPGGAG